MCRGIAKLERRFLGKEMEQRGRESREDNGVVDSTRGSKKVNENLKLNDQRKSSSVPGRATVPTAVNSKAGSQRLTGTGAGSVVTSARNTVADASSGEPAKFSDAGTQTAAGASSSSTAAVPGPKDITTKDPDSDSVWIPIFVSTVAVPGIQFSMHVYEPRYRLMIRRCLEETVVMNQDAEMVNVVEGASASGEVEDTTRGGPDAKRLKASDISNAELNQANNSSSHDSRKSKSKSKSKESARSGSAVSGSAAASGSDFSMIGRSSFDSNPKSSAPESSSSASGNNGNASNAGDLAGALGSIASSASSASCGADSANDDNADSKSLATKNRPYRHHKKTFPSFGMHHNLRADFGCLVEVRTFKQLTDGRANLEIAGTRRYKVLEWDQRDGYYVGRVRFLDGERGDVNDQASKLRGTMNFGKNCFGVEDPDNHTKEDAKATDNSTAKPINATGRKSSSKGAAKPVNSKEGSNSGTAAMKSSKKPVSNPAASHSHSVDSADRDPDSDSATPIFTRNELAEYRLKEELRKGKNARYRAKKLLKELRL